MIRLAEDEPKDRPRANPTLRVDLASSAVGLVGLRQVIQQTTVTRALRTFMRDSARWITRIAARDV